jgi:hypothetical protein
MAEEITAPIRRRPRETIARLPAMASPLNQNGCEFAKPMKFHTGAQAARGTLPVGSLGIFV